MYRILIEKPILFSVIKVQKTRNVLQLTKLWISKMKKSRAYITRLLNNLKTLKSNYEGILKDSATVVNIENLKSIDPFLALTELLTKAQKSLPIGYRYTGPFYIKQCEQYIKHDGVLFMRENLVSWIIEKGTDRHDPCYHRNIFKQPEEGCELKKEDAELVFEQN